MWLSAEPKRSTPRGNGLAGGMTPVVLRPMKTAISLPDEVFEATRNSRGTCPGHGSRASA